MFYRLINCLLFICSVNTHAQVSTPSLSISDTRLHIYGIAQFELSQSPPDWRSITLANLPLRLGSGVQYELGDYRRWSVGYEYTDGFNDDAERCVKFYIRYR